MRCMRTGKPLVLVTLLAVAILAAREPSPIEEAQKELKAAQEKSDWAAVVEKGIALGSMLSKAAAQPKPESFEDAAWKNQVERWRAERVQAEFACFDATMRETDPAKKVKLLEQFIAAFEGGDYAKRSVGVLAGVYQQTGDRAKAVASANKALETDP